MIKEYKINSDQIVIKSDLVAEFPSYIYLDDSKQILLYSEKIKELLDDSRVLKPLEITNEGISFLLQSGVVPIPQTIYKNIFIVGVGDTAVIRTMNNKVDIEFSHEFPFFNKNRNNEADVDENYIIEMLAEATISRLKVNTESYLFHSAGKDSNMIALSLAEAGHQNKITCITHQSKGDTDESEISKNIASKLGFKHQILYEPNTLDKKHMDSFEYYFENIPLPCTDDATLAYSLYTSQVEFQNANIIDGSGNDIYMGHIPSNLEFDRQAKYSFFHRLRPIAGKLSSGSRFDIITKTKTEYAGMNGISYGDSQHILKDAYNVYGYWKNEDEKRHDWDYFDIRADIWGSLVEYEKVMRKAKNLANINNINLIFPFTNHKVTEYFSKLPEKYLFNRDEFKNKLIFRKILRDRISLDSDKLGKMVYSFDFYSILMKMKKEVDHEILSCKLWNKNGIEKILASLYHKIDSNHKYRLRLTYLVQRLYLISAWYNHNKYVKR